MTQKDQLLAAQTRVEEVETLNTDLLSQIENLNVVIEAQNAAKAELNERISELTVANEALTQSERSLTDSNKALVESNQKLEAEAKTAEVRAREINARMQVSLPGKPAQAGDELEEPKTEGLKGRARLTAAFETEFAK